mgnify:CR=1 FL=1
MNTLRDVFLIPQNLHRTGTYLVRYNRHLIHRVEYVTAARGLLLHCSSNLIADRLDLIGKGKNAAKRLFDGTGNTGNNQTQADNAALRAAFGLK